MREDAMGEPTVESIQERCRERKKRRTPALPCVFRLPGRRRGELGLDVAGCVTHARCPLAAPVALSAVATVEGGTRRCGRRGGDEGGESDCKWLLQVGGKLEVVGPDSGCGQDDGGVCDGERSSARLGTPVVVYGMLGMGRGAWQAEASSGGGIVRKLLVAGEKLKTGSCGMGSVRGGDAAHGADGARRVWCACRRGIALHLHSDGCWWSREMSWAKLEGGGDGAGGGREEKQREAAARGAAIQTIVADAERQYAEKREEDDQREQRTGYRTGAGVHEEGECESAIRVDEKYAPEVKWDRTPISKHGMTNWKPPVCQSSAAAGSSTLDTTGLWSKPETNGWYTSPSCPRGRGTEPGASAATGIHVRAGSWVHMELNLIGVRSMSEIKTAFNDMATDLVEKGVNWHLPQDET
ncbi:hypothetical protein B0H13DRAFT_2406478 [Mycena leptocephala]|nr:hypothetical protein B0H13DRAFT_2406478 [Mycena leptocephala]